jgi:hypothetical protein
MDHSKDRSQLKVGDTVKFLSPLNDDEALERFIVLENRGSRVLVEAICNMKIKPTFVYQANDLIATLNE